MDWEIERTRQACAKCAGEFPEETVFYSAIFDRVTRFERLDFCAGCWPPAEEPFSFWQSRIPAKNEKPKPLVDDETLLDFFLKLENDDTELKQNFRFLLTLILMRKRILQFDGSITRDGQSYMKVRCARRDSRHEVLDVDLTEEQIASLQNELVAILNVESVESFAASSNQESPE